MTQQCCYTGVYIHHHQSGIHQYLIQVRRNGFMHQFHLLVHVSINNGSYLCKQL